MSQDKETIQEGTVKRSPSSSDESSDDDDNDVFGPSLIAPNKTTQEETEHAPKPEEQQPRKKKRKVRSVIPESVLAANLPMNEHYRYSYEQESVISAIAKTSSDELVVIGMKNGTIKFFKKTVASNANSAGKSGDGARGSESGQVDGQLTFIKQFAAHPRKPVCQLLVSEDDSYLSSIAQDDDNVKIFDLGSLDMTQAVKLSFTPNVSTSMSSCWFRSISNSACLAISDQNSANIHLLDPHNDAEATTVKKVHRFPLTSIAFCYKHQCFVSADTKGIVEYWNENGDLPSAVSFHYKSETNLFDIAKSKSKVTSIDFSPDSESMVMTSYPDSFIRIFEFKTGKLLKKLDQSLVAYEQRNTTSSKLLNFERRIVAEKLDTLSNHSNASFDNTGKILIFPSIAGITLLNLQTMKVIKMLGQDDQIRLTTRFTHPLLINKSAIDELSSEMLVAENALIDTKLSQNPTIITTAINSNRLYVFNNKEKTTDEQDFSLAVSSHSQVSSSANQRGRSTIYTKATLHTSMGDIKIKLFPTIAPRTVDNFVKLSAKRYYNNVVFHRVIKDFMIQTGDPLGDGTGGQSAWGGNFGDEFSPLLKHSKPYMVSMANSGPNTNGSQFFITTAATPWLDNKHSIFGEVVEGTETVRAIEAAETDENDRPLDQIAILSTSVES